MNDSRHFDAEENPCAVTREGHPHGDAGLTPSDRARMARVQAVALTTLGALLGGAACVVVWYIGVPILLILVPPRSRTPELAFAALGSVSGGVGAIFACLGAHFGFRKFIRVVSLVRKCIAAMWILVSTLAAATHWTIGIYPDVAALVSGATIVLALTVASIAETSAQE